MQTAYAPVSCLGLWLARRLTLCQTFVTVTGWPIQFGDAYTSIFYREQGLQSR